MNKEELLQGVRYTDSILKSIVSGCKPVQALIVDLNEGESYPFDIPQAYLEKYYGGVALGYRLWADFAGYSVDDEECLESENPVVLIPSSIQETGMPYGNLCNIVFRSPVTKRLEAVSFPADISISPYAGLIIIGRTDKNCLLECDGEGVKVCGAENLNGLSTSEIGALYKNCITTGPAADKNVRYASVVYKKASTGRSGLGFVFSKKHIKTIIFPSSVQNKNSEFDSEIVLKTDSEQKSGQRFGKNNNKYDKLRNELSKKNLDDRIIERTISAGSAPVNNFNLRTDPRLIHLISSKFGLSTLAVSVPFEARLMLGSNIGLYDIRKIVYLYNYCVDNGLDPVSTGCILGWIKTSKSRMDRNSLKFLKNIDFKNAGEITDFLDEMIKGTVDIDKKPFLNSMAEGLEELSFKYGGKEYAHTINSLECGPFDFRGTYCEALNSSLGNSFYVYLAFKDNTQYANIARQVYFNERLVFGLETLGINPMIVFSLCNKMPATYHFLLRYSFFSLKYSFNYKVLTDAISKALDKKFSFSTILSLGMNAKALREKINSFLEKAEYRIPDYFCVEPESAHKVSSVVPIHSLIDDYKSLLSTGSYN